jgi:hypothetical protein
VEPLGQTAVAHSINVTVRHCFDLTASSRFCTQYTPLPYTQEHFTSKQLPSRTDHKQSSQFSSTCRADRPPRSVQKMDGLPEEEQLLVWRETERNFWDDMKRRWAEDQEEAEKAYQQATVDIKVEVARSNGQLSQLAETRDRLAKELAQVEAELSRVARSMEDRANTLLEHDLEYRKKQQERLATRQNVTKAMTNYFREQRGEKPLDNDVDLDDALQDQLKDAHQSRIPNQSIASEPVSEPAVEHERIPDTNSTDATVSVAFPNATAPTTNGHGPAPRPENPTDVLVDVIDATGKVIGPVQRIQPWNQWVEAIQDKPIQREVKIRRGRRFTQEHLASIYERSEAKGVKWLACMIQATGTVQSKRCVSCDKNQGAFDECIVLGGELFPKCGNCEWNRQGCHGASGEVADDTTRPVRRMTDLASILGDPEEEMRVRRKQAAQAALVKAAGLDMQPTTETDFTMRAIVNGNGSPPGRYDTERHPLPTGSRDYYSGGFTPANGRSRPPSNEAQTPTAASFELSPQPTPQPASTEDLPEINKENLILQHDGTHYTYPECVQGVPLAKIDENHPYWDPAWQNPRTAIESALQVWKDKNQAILEEEARGEKKGSARYQTGRQVNRGQRILEFLDEGTLSPYQLLAKRYTMTGKGGITSYDTLFRLAETIFELSKFNLDVKPEDWIRHRLNELIIDQGFEFNYGRTMHDFYHDPKLSALRAKHGYKSIGRPSGASLARQSLGSTVSTPRTMPKKRKSTHSQTVTPRDSPSMERSPLIANVVLPPESPFSTHLQKRPKHLAPIEGAVHDEFETGDHSEVDSLCGSPLMKTDWRLYQVKTRLYTSSTNVTQYWTWQQNKRRFEHQVLTEIDPAQWGNLKEPINFHFVIDEVAEMRWNIHALRIKIVMRRDRHVVYAKKDGQPRGDIMAAFKRPNTMRRFLAFCRGMKMNLVKVSRCVLGLMAKRPHLMSMRC